MASKFRTKALNKAGTLYCYYYRTHENTESSKFTHAEHCELNRAPLKLAAKACKIQQSLGFTLYLLHLIIVSHLSMGLQSQLMGVSMSRHFIRKEGNMLQTDQCLSSQSQLDADWSAF